MGRTDVLYVGFVSLDMKDGEGDPLEQFASGGSEDKQEPWVRIQRGLGFQFNGMVTASLE